MIRTRKEYKVYLNKEIGSGIRFVYRSIFNPPYSAVYLIRKSQYYNNSVLLLKRIIARRCCRILVKKYGIFVSPMVKIGIGLRLPHPNGIIIGTNGIGKNCTIFQQVTIGSARYGDAKKHLQPEIGDNVTLFAGCKVLGDIKIADGTTIGANAVVTKDTEANNTYVGVPARKI